MEYDNEENFLEILGVSGHDQHSMDEDEALLDEEEEDVVSGEEEEVVEGEEEEGESGNSGESGEEDEDNGDAVGEVSGGADADAAAAAGADAGAGAEGGYGNVRGVSAAENMIVQEGEVGAGELEVRDGISRAGSGNVAGGSGVERGRGTAMVMGRTTFSLSWRGTSWITVSARITDSLRFEPWWKAAAVQQN
jgi:hypothetical protein